MLSLPACELYVESPELAGASSSGCGAVGSARGDGGGAGGVRSRQFGGACGSRGAEKAPGTVVRPWRLGGRVVRDAGWRGVGVAANVKGERGDSWKQSASSGSGVHVFLVDERGRKASERALRSARCCAPWPVSEGTIRRHGSQWQNGPLIQDRRRPWQEHKPMPSPYLCVCACEHLTAFSWPKIFIVMPIGAGVQCVIALELGLMQRRTTQADGTAVCLSPGDTRTVEAIGPGASQGALRCDPD